VQKKTQSYVGKNPQNAQTAFFQKKIREFPKLDIFKMSKIEKSLENIEKKRVCGFCEYFSPMM